MATYGQLRHIVEQRYPGVSSDLRDHYIKERYRQILDEVNWRGLQTQAILQTVAEYTTGTIAVTNGSATVTGTGTTFTSAMTGREIRITGREEFYEITFVSTTEVTLSRAYEGDTDSETTYRIFERIYALASDIDILESVKRINSGRDMDPVSRELLDEQAPARPFHGKPTRYAHHDYDSNARPQVELYPIPDKAWGIPYRYTKRPADFSATTDVLEEWIPVSLVTEGAMADLAMVAGSATDAQTHEGKFERLLAGLRRKEARNRPARQMQMPARHVRHRRARGSG